MKFSIRDLLLVTVIVALAVGWWVDRSRLVSKEEEAIARFEMLKRFVTRQGYRVEWKPEHLMLDISGPGEQSLPNSSAPAPKLPKE